MLSADELQEWARRAQRAQARLATLGIPIQIKTTSDGGVVTSLEVTPGPLAMIALMEMLAGNIEAFLNEDEDTRRYRLAYGGEGNVH